MRGLLLFICGTLVGLFIQSALAQRDNPGVLQVNHVGIAVNDLDESLAFYKDTLGFREAFRVTNREGRVGLVYLQVSDNTFIEVTTANADRPAGLTHFGIQVDDAEAARAMFAARGANPTETRSGSTKAILSDIFDPQGIRIELSEYPPDSLQGQALGGR